MSCPGMETTAMSFVYMAYGLARDEKSWATLREELNTIDYSDPHHVEALRGLQYIADDRSTGNPSRVRPGLGLPRARRPAGGRRARRVPHPTRLREYRFPRQRAQKLTRRPGAARRRPGIQRAPRRAYLPERAHRRPAALGPPGAGDGQVGAARGRHARDARVVLPLRCVLPRCPHPR